MNGIMTAALLATVVVAAGCDVGGSGVDRGLAVYGGGGATYPGRLVPCDSRMRCSDMRAEIDLWVSREAADRGPVAGVTFHAPADEAGRPALITRSGGDTWIAVVAFADGSRLALMVGCGIGIDPDRCFATP